MSVFYSFLFAAVLEFHVTVVKSEFRDAPEVRTASGVVSGIHLHTAGTDVDAYLGIPFARPPTGELRFKKPLPVRPWNGTLLAERMHPGCVQTNFTVIDGVQLDMSRTDEDCLKLNVWVPKRNCSGDSAPPCEQHLPVFVYLYGGFFTWGTSDFFLYDGLELAARANVIYASFNYRVGILGFLNASSPEAPGNMGLYDQVEALRWIHKNIVFFGGDPKAITVAGQSAGAISVSYHMISKMSEGLFQRAVLMSGTPGTIAYAGNIDQMTTFQSISANLNCTDFRKPIDVQISESIDCLRKIDAHQLVRQSEKDLALRYITILPGYGDAFLPKSPIDLDSSKFHVKDVLLGTTDDDGAFLTTQFQGNMKWLKGAIDGPTVLRLFLRGYFNIRAAKSLALADAYFGPTQGENEVDALKKLSTVITDLSFECATDLFSEDATKHNVSVYRYLFHHRPSFSFWGDWITVTHNDDLPFMLGTLRVDQKSLKTHGESFAALLKDLAPPDQELRFSEELIGTLAEFCRTG